MKHDFWQEKGKWVEDQKRKFKHKVFDQAFQNHRAIMGVTKKTGTRLEQWPRSVDKGNTMKRLLLTFQIGMLHLEACQPDNVGKKFHLFTLK